jgi:DNA-binding transcriptional regulator YiaG
MSPDDLKDMLARLGFSQSGAARILGVDSRTVRRWIAGDRDIPAPAVVFFRLLDEFPDALHYVKAKWL